MIDKLARAILTIIGVSLGAFIGVIVSRMNIFDFTDMQNIFVIIILGLIFGIIFFLLTPKVKKAGLNIVSTFEKELLKFSTGDIILGAAGLIVGFIIAFLISQPFTNIKYLGPVIAILSYLLFGYLGIKIATRKKDDVIWPSINLKKSPLSKNKSDKNQASGNISPKILDTSVIIDGRIADICRTGFIEGSLIIPEFVLKELRHIADSSDSLKRNRGRRGLDILNILQKGKNSRCCDRI